MTTPPVAVQQEGQMMEVTEQGAECAARQTESEETADATATAPACNMALRSAVFEVLRRHDVSEQCLAEVAMVTRAALAAKDEELAAVKAREAKLREVAEAFVATLTDNSMNEDRCLSFRHAELVDCISRARAALSGQQP